MQLDDKLMPCNFTHMDMDYIQGHFIWLESEIETLCK